MAEEFQVLQWIFPCPAHTMFKVEVSSMQTGSEGAGEFLWQSDRKEEREQLGLPVHHCSMLAVAARYLKCFDN